MEPVIVITFTALLASLLTLFCGFGLGTIMLPVFSFFFPAELAVLLTAVLHFGNNLFKMALLGRSADRSVVLMFGIPSLFAAFIGAYVLTIISDLTVNAVIPIPIDTGTDPLKFIIGLLIVVFALLEVFTPRLSIRRRSVGLLLTGGLLSGFFGGLSGHQGALRTTFLAGIGLSKNAFVGTGVMIACMVDAARISVYLPGMKATLADVDLYMMVMSLLAAFTGAILGKRILGKIELKWLMNLVAFLLVTFGVLMMMGVI
jgi:uncharacterized membrane protein YfcA